MYKHTHTAAHWYCIVAMSPTGNVMECLYIRQEVFILSPGQHQLTFQQVIYLKQQIYIISYKLMQFKE